ncbi:hypothetical protein VDG1235_3090 [Verrucomicrobiia bacterium DG1235]|nr:hypothetical protein VDG1235_3090 [Verrucomicrobiae bacterium DG1235]
MHPTTRLFLGLALATAPLLTQAAEELPQISLSVTAPIVDSYQNEPGAFIFKRTGDLSENFYVPIRLVGTYTDGPSNIAAPGIDYRVESSAFLDEEPQTSADSYSDIVGVLAMGANHDTFALKIIPMNNWYNHSSKVVVLQIQENPEQFTVEGDSLAEYTIENRSYNLWAEKRTLPNDLADPELDADHDGLSNLAEYALLSDPNKPNSIAYAQPELVNIDGRYLLGVSFDRLSNTEDLLSYSLEVNNGEANWSGTVSSTKIHQTRPNGTERVTLYTADELTDPIPATLFRVKIRLLSRTNTSS